MNKRKTWLASFCNSKPVVLTELINYIFFMLSPGAGNCFLTDWQQGQVNIAHLQSTAFCQTLPLSLSLFVDTIALPLFCPFSATHSYQDSRHLQAVSTGRRVMIVLHSFIVFSLRHRSSHFCCGGTQKFNSKQRPTHSHTHVHIVTDTDVWCHRVGG